MIAFAALQVIRKIINHVIAQFAAQYEDCVERGVQMADGDCRLWKVALKIRDSLNDANINEN